jgi:hypothetical protein
MGWGSVTGDGVRGAKNPTRFAPDGAKRPPLFKGRSENQESYRTFPALSCSIASKASLMART